MNNDAGLFSKDDSFAYFRIFSFDVSTENIVSSKMSHCLLFVVFLIHFKVFHEVALQLSIGLVKLEFVRVVGLIMI